MTTANIATGCSLRERVVVVTGASRGLGRAIAVAASGAGATVVGVARSFASGGHEPFHPMTFDLRETGDVDGLVDSIEEAHGPVDGVVHAAGVQLRKAAVDVTLDEWAALQRVNVEAPYFLSTALARRQLAAGTHGSHLFVGSLATALGFSGVSPYCAAKSAIAGVVRSLATEWAPSGIRVNGLGPGYFETDLTRDVLALPEARRRITGRIPLGRIGEPDELAGAALFLLSDASSYVTGQFIYVDGGWLAG